MKIFAKGVVVFCLLASSAMAQNDPTVVAVPAKSTARILSDADTTIGSSYYNAKPKRSMMLTARPKPADSSAGGSSDCGCQTQSSSCGCNNSCSSSCSSGCSAGPRVRVGLSFFNRGCNDCQQDCSCCCQPCKYRSIFGGLTLLEDLPNLLTNGNNVGFNDGFVVGMASGRYLNANTRVELEGSWRNNTVETGPTTFGRINNYATMANIYRDFGNGQIKPYIGGGIGFSLVKAEMTVLGTPFEIDDYAFAYQGIAGVSFQQASNRDLFVEYRFFGNTVTDVLDAVGTDVGDFTYLSHNLVFGLRFNR